MYECTSMVRSGILKLCFINTFKHYVVKRDKLCVCIFSIVKNCSFNNLGLELKKVSTVEQMKLMNENNSVFMFKNKEN